MLFFHKLVREYYIIVKTYYDLVKMDYSFILNNFFKSSVSSLEIYNKYVIL